MQECSCVGRLGLIFFWREGCFWFGCLPSLSSACVGSACSRGDGRGGGAEVGDWSQHPQQWRVLHTPREVGAVAGAWSRDPWWQWAAHLPGEAGAAVGTQSWDA